MVYVEICLPNSIFGTSVNRQSAAFSSLALVDWSSHTKPGDLYPWMCCLASHENIQIASFENCSLPTSTMFAEGTVKVQPYFQNSSMIRFWSNKAAGSQPWTSRIEKYDPTRFHKCHEFLPCIFHPLKITTPTTQVTSHQEIVVKSQILKERNISSWWLNQPLWKILVKLEIFPKWGWK